MKTIPTHSGANDGSRPALNGINRILVPVDFSRPSYSVIDTALALLQGNSRAQLSILHVVEPLPGTELIDFPKPMEPGPMIDNARDILSKLRMTYGHRITFSTNVVEGDAVKEIVEMAERGHFDLIAMSSHGRSGLGRVLLGSVAEGVAQRSTCPVLVLKPAKYLEYAAVPGMEEAPFKNILVGCDHSAGAVMALNLATKIAEKGKARITLIHAIPSIEGRLILNAVRHDKKDSPAIAESDLRLESIRKSFFPLSENWDIASVIGSPWDVLVDRALATSCDLIVIGPAARPHGLSSLVGNMANKLIRLSPCSVLAVR